MTAQGFLTRLLVPITLASCFWVPPAAGDSPKPRLFDAYQVAEKAPEPHRRLAKKLIETYERVSRSSLAGARLYYSPDKQINAFATVIDGTRIVAFYGPLLMAFENDPDALAYVVGHELAHHQDGHTTRGIDARVALGALAAIAGAVIDYKLEQRGSSKAGLGQVAGYVVGNLVVMKYTRDQEREADATGLRMMTEAGFDPRGAVRAQERMLRMSGHKDFVLFDSHPSSGERMENLRAQIQSDPVVLAAVQRRGGSSPTVVALAPASAQATPDNPAPVGVAPATATAFASSSSSSAPAIWKPNAKLQQLQREMRDASAPERFEALKRLAEEDPEARAELATIVAAGRGTAKDQDEACRLAKSAFDAGAVNASTPWGLCLVHAAANTQAFEVAHAGWYKHRVRQSLTLLGLFHERGVGTPAYPRYAEEAYRQAARLGDSTAAVAWAKLLESGKMGARSKDQIDHLYGEAATHGNLVGMVEYATIIMADGTQEALIAAHQWVSLAEFRGETRAPALRWKIEDGMRAKGMAVPADAHRAAMTRLMKVADMPILLPQ